MYTSPYLGCRRAKQLYTSLYLSHRRAKQLCIPPLTWATEKPAMYTSPNLGCRRAKQLCVLHLIWAAEEPYSYVYLPLSEPQRSQTAMYTSHLIHRRARYVYIPLIWAAEELNNRVYLLLSMSKIFLSNFVYLPLSGPRESQISVCHLLSGPKKCQITGFQKSQTTMFNFPFLPHRQVKYYIWVPSLILAAAETNDCIVLPYWPQKSHKVYACAQNL